MFLAPIKLPFNFKRTQSDVVSFSLPRSCAACISGDARPPVVLRREGMGRRRRPIKNLTRWCRQYKHCRGQGSRSFSAQAQAVSYLSTGHEIRAQRTANKKNKYEEQRQTGENDLPSLPFNPSNPSCGDFQTLPDCGSWEELVFFFVTNG